MYGVSWVWHNISMIQRPSFVSDNQIVAQLHESYGLNVKTLQFIPVGEASWCYKAIEADEHTCFVKIVRHKLDPLSVTIPALLYNEMGYHFVIPAVPNRQDLLWTSLAQHNLVVYPYLKGKTVMDNGFLFERWQEVGSIFAVLHQTKLPNALRQMLKSESFIPAWEHEAEKVVRYTATSGLVGSSYELAHFILSKEQEIQAILARTEALGRLLREQNSELVLCHADPNQSNILVNNDGRIVLIDWDDVMLAPRERDLMFFTGKEQEQFLSDYDKTKAFQLNLTAIAYYKYEWVVQEIGSYGSQIFFSDSDEITQQHALQEFYKLFAPDDVVQEAYDFDVDMHI